VAAARHGADLVAISALLTTTMTQIPHIVEALKGAGLRDRLKVVVGGAPLTEAFPGRVGADGYAPDASRAVRLARELVGVV
jgi:5-methyltetrahydrofolate--homocysteine methyltransferase